MTKDSLLLSFLRLFSGFFKISAILLIMPYRPELAVQLSMVVGGMIFFTRLIYSSRSLIGTNKENRGRSAKLYGEFLKLTRSYTFLLLLLFTIILTFIEKNSYVLAVILSSFGIAIFSSHYNEEVRYSSNNRIMESQANWEVKRLLLEFSPVFLALACLYFGYQSRYLLLLISLVTFFIICTRFQFIYLQHQKIDWLIFIEEYRSRWFLFVFLSSIIISLDRMIVNILGSQALIENYVTFIALTIPITSFLGFVLIWAGKREERFSIRLKPTVVAFVSILVIWILIPIILNVLKGFEIRIFDYFNEFVQSNLLWLILGSFILLARDILMQLVFQRKDLSRLFIAPCLGCLAMITAIAANLYFPFILILPIIVSVASSILLTVSEGQNAG